MVTIRKTIHLKHAFVLRLRRHPDCHHHRGEGRRISKEACIILISTDLVRKSRYLSAFNHHICLAENKHQLIKINFLILYLKKSSDV
jgi:hypothetical protein